MTVGLRWEYGCLGPGPQWGTQACPSHRVAGTMLSESHITSFDCLMSVSGCVSLCVTDEEVEVPEGKCQNEEGGLFHGQGN